MKRYYFFHRQAGDDEGQGLVEYALLLVLVAVVVIAILTLLGPAIFEVFCQVSAGLNGASGTGGCIVVTRSDFNSNNNHLQLEANLPGGYDPNVTLTASPGGTMGGHPAGNPDRYRLFFTVPGTCPCEITITSSEGASTTITVGP